MNKVDVARWIDHAVLKPELSLAEAENEIKAGIAHRVRTVCVRPCDIETAVRLCAGTETEVSCVLGFPHGDSIASVKAFEAAEYVRLGAREIDMVVNYGRIRSGDLAGLEREIRAVVEVAKPAGVLVKTIFETCTLTREEIMHATRVAADCGADFVKTSTGFHAGGATVEAVQAMLDAAEGRIAVKASGGIRDLATALRYIEMGCARLGVGSSTTAALVAGSRSNEAY